MVNKYLPQETAALPGVLKEEEAIKEKDELLREAQEEVARECRQQCAVGDETAALPGVLKEEEAIKEKDELLREAQLEGA